MTVDTRTHTLKSKHLAAAIGLNAVVFLVEIVGGVLTNSFALISDALHNFSDLLALALSYTASRIVLWKANSQKSYGYGRLEILVAFTNAAALVIIGHYVIYEAAWRFADPRVINGTWMLGIASLAFAANLTGTILLKQHAHADLNMKSAYLHLLTDAVESIGVVVVAAVIAWQGWKVLDPLISIGIGGFIIKSAWDVISETTHLLLKEHREELIWTRSRGLFNHFLESGKYIMCTSGVLTHIYAQ